MAHICIKRFGTRYGQEDGTENNQCNEAMLINETDRVDRIYGQQNIQPFADVYETEDCHYAEPEKRYWSESSSDTPGTVALDHEQRNQDCAGNRQYPRPKGRSYELQTFNRRQHRNCRRDDGITEKQ